VEELIPDYNSSRFVISEKHEELLERKIISKNLSTGRVALDLGGGYGRLTGILLDRYKYVVLIDYSINNLERAMKVLDRERTVFLHADIRNPPIMDGSVDFILSLRVMHHYSNLGFLGFISRKLRKDGMFLFNVNNISSPLFAFHMIKSVITGKGIRLNMLKQGVQEVSDDSGNRNIFFLNYRHILGFVPSDCRVERVIGSGMFHNSLIETKSDFLNIERLTNTEILISNAFKNAWFFPDVFMLLRKEGLTPDQEANGPLDAISCIKCGSHLKQENDEVVCAGCGNVYGSEGDIIDMVSRENR
jgi:SAM-dependent methyltransferase